MKKNQEYISPQELLDAKNEKEAQKRRKLARKEEKRLKKLEKKKAI